MSNYKGPVAIKIKPQFVRQKKEEPKESFEFPEGPTTKPMDGFSVHSYLEDLFQIPSSTRREIDDLTQLNASYTPVPKIAMTLKEEKLDNPKGYKMEEIKAVLYVHGVTIPKGTAKKEQYAELARKAGLVS